MIDPIQILSVGISLALLVLVLELDPYFSA